MLRFKDIDLTNVDFTDADLRRSTFVNVILTNVTFDNTQLNNAKFCDVVLRNSRVTNETKFDFATFENVTFDDTEINNSSFYHTIFNSSDFLLSSVQGISMESVHANNLSFISCALLNDIRFQNAILQSVLILTPDIIGELLDFSLATLSGCSFLGNEISKRSFLSQSTFYGTKIQSCFFSNVHFNNCLQIDQISGGLTSIFQNVFSTNERDIESLISSGAKVNGQYSGVYKVFWENKNETNFFVDLLKGFGLGVASNLIAGLGVAAAGSACCIL